jgi:hypothetical protein
VARETHQGNAGHPGIRKEKDRQEGYRREYVRGYEQQVRRAEDEGKEKKKKKKRVSWGTITEIPPSPERW